MTATPAPLDRRTASDQIDDIRKGLRDQDQHALSGIVAELWDGYPIAEVKGGLRYLSLRDREAQQRIEAIVNAIVEDGGVCGGYEGDGWQDIDCEGECCAAMRENWDDDED